MSQGTNLKLHLTWYIYIKKRDIGSRKVYQNKKWAMKKKNEKSPKKVNQNIIWEI
jgi:hypothetical protein